ncbi:hypothetical protein PB1_02530 [Bacillus methanolicus PB1]|uniref:Uncharacterized protein n=1 Tax=Bacillus methanolicus PB1 TaxID=997296 RepID=I3E5K8_BACMT|nr:hypothetical protein PB1_02530 [Bacillus methanolicus PB1]
MTVSFITQFTMGFVYLTLLLIVLGMFTSIYLLSKRE